jgi:hypothetical protein
MLWEAQIPSPLAIRARGIEIAFAARRAWGESIVGVEVELSVMNDWRRALRVPGRRMKLTRSQRVRELAVELEVKTWDERQDEVRSS